jgi:hypothetical protein
MEQTGSMIITDIGLINEAHEWMSALARLEPPSPEHLTLRFRIVAGPRPIRSYLLMSFEDPENDSGPGLDSFPTLAEALEAMKETVRCLTHHGWRFVFNFREC